MALESHMQNNTGSHSLVMENSPNRSSSDHHEHAVLNVAYEQGEVAISVGSFETQNNNNNNNNNNDNSNDSSSSGSNGGGFGSNPRHRRSPLNSRLWICIEVAISVSQIIASIIVLSLSTNEKPRVPLSIWVSGYALGCFATLPLLYRRYTHLYITLQGQSHSNSTAGMPVPQGEDSHTAFQSSTRRSNRDAALSDSRVNIFVERFKMALDCFFAVWFVVGNVWIFGGHSSSSEAPNLYRLCIVFLTFSCIGYAMPFVLCVTICCCLPCIISLLGYQEDQVQIKGAPPEVINSLQTYKFKAKGANGRHKNKDDIDSDSEGSSEGVFVSAGTENERAVSAPDAVCCICLGKYKDGVELRELPCMHHFHIECVDKWLKINASCPLCKHEVAQYSRAAPEPSEAEEQRDRSQCG